MNSVTPYVATWIGQYPLLHDPDPSEQQTIKKPPNQNFGYFAGGKAFLNPRWGFCMLDGGYWAEEGMEEVLKIAFRKAPESAKKFVEQAIRKTRKWFQNQVKIDEWYGEDDGFKKNTLEEIQNAITTLAADFPGLFEAEKESCEENIES